MYYNYQSAKVCHRSLKEELNSEEFLLKSLNCSDSLETSLLHLCPVPFVSHCFALVSILFLMQQSCLNSHGDKLLSTSLDLMFKETGAFFCFLPIVARKKVQVFRY